MMAPGAPPHSSVLDYPSMVCISTVLRHMTVQCCVAVDSQDLAGSPVKTGASPSRYNKIAPTSDGTTRRPNTRRDYA